MLSLPNLTSIGGDYGVSVEVSGTGSEVDLPGLTAINTTYSYEDTLSVIEQGTVQAGLLDELERRGRDTRRYRHNRRQPVDHPHQRQADGHRRRLCTTASGATADNTFSNLADIDGSGLYIYGGGSLTLPAVLTYTNNNVLLPPTFRTTLSASRSPTPPTVALSVCPT